MDLPSTIEKHIVDKIWEISKSVDSGNKLDEAEGIECDKKAVTRREDVSVHETEISLAAIPVKEKKRSDQGFALDLPNAKVKSIVDKKVEIAKSVDVGKNKMRQKGMSVTRYQWQK